MSKKTEKTEEFEELKTETVQLEKDFDFDTWELKTTEDYRIYNKHCHRAFREAKKNNPKCDPPFPVKVPDESFHRKVKIKFQRFDQPENVLKTRVRTAEIDWKGQLKPGSTYTLPVPVVKFLNNLATPIFAECKIEDGGEIRTETRQVGEKNRFSCHLLEF